jgi:hypothetical protein
VLVTLDDYVVCLLNGEMSGTRKHAGAGWTNSDEAFELFSARCFSRDDVLSTSIEIEC